MVGVLNKITIKAMYYNVDVTKCPKDMAWGFAIKTALESGDITVDEINEDWSLPKETINRVINQNK